MAVLSFAPCIDLDLCLHSLHSCILAEAAGRDDPLQILYVDTEEQPVMAEAVFLVILSASSRLRYQHSSGRLVRDNKAAPDGAVLAAGITTLIRQLPNTYLQASLRQGLLIPL